MSGCRAKAGMNAAADGKLAAKSNNPFSAPGTDSAGSAPAEAAQGAIDEGDIEAEGIESALVSLERVTALLTINCIQGVSPGMKVSSRCYVQPATAFQVTRSFISPLRACHISSVSVCCA